MSYVFPFPTKSISKDTIVLSFSAVGVGLAYASTLLLGPLTATIYSALILFGWAIGVITASSVLALTTDEPQWQWLMRGQLVALMAFAMLCIPLLF